jgi:hypothetical protein
VCTGQQLQCSHHRCLSGLADCCLSGWEGWEPNTAQLLCNQSQIGLITALLSSEWDVQFMPGWCDFNRSCMLPLCYSPLQEVTGSL